MLDNHFPILSSTYSMHQEYTHSWRTGPEGNSSVCVCGGGVVWMVLEKFYSWTKRNTQEETSPHAVGHCSVKK